MSDIFPVYFFKDITAVG